MVVSSVTPRSSAAIAGPAVAGLLRASATRTSKTTFCSWLAAVAGSGASPFFSASTPRWTSMVASPPSSRIMLAFSSPGQIRICWVHHQYSSSVSPFQAKTGHALRVVDGAVAARRRRRRPRGPGWRRCCTRPSAPRRRASTRVSIRTAVWIVMCSEPAIFARRRAACSRSSARASPSGRASRARRGVISVRPKSASARSATLKSICSVPPALRATLAAASCLSG